VPEPNCYFADVHPDPFHNTPPTLCDGDVDIADVQRVSGCWNQDVDETCPEALDFNRTGLVDVFDITTVAEEWGYQQQR
jgi:hypothetical protein